jgi:hypothetical protein
MRINKYFPFAFIYFFFNSAALPFGLTYTALLSPLFYWWVLKKRKQDILLPFFLVLFPFVFVHVAFIGVNIKTYIVSILNLTTVYIFCQAFYTFLKQSVNAEIIFNRLLIINFIFCLVAIPFYFTSYYNIFWIQQFLTEGVDNYKRLKLFTYEASYYATLLIPLFFFYLLQIILNQNKINAWLILAVILLPYIFSFSLGVLSCMALAISIVLLFYFKTLIRKKRVVNIIGVIILFIIPLFIGVIIFYPDNTLFIRIHNIFSGSDLSGRGRTFDAFILANKILDGKSYFWGIGPGQIKILGADIIRDFYLYPLDYDIIAIPNATAETLTIFGWFGLFLRLFIELALFFYTKVWTSYYRLLLFLFVFLYQFTGSFITSIAEYFIWILAFTEVFPQFQVKFYLTAIPYQKKINTLL